MQLSKQVAAPHLTSTESFQDSPLSSWSEAVSINQSKRKTSYANGQTNLGHKHKAPDHNHEATQPMVDLPHTS